MVWYERCGLHLCGRVINVMLHKFNLVMPVYSLSKILKIRHQKIKIMRSVDKFIEGNYKPNNFHEGYAAPHRPTTEPSFRAKLRSLIVLARVSNNFDAEETVAKNQKVKNIDELLSFWNGDVTQPDLQHFCNGCCRDFEHSLQRAKVPGAKRTS